MPMLENLKSAEVIADVDKAYELLSKRMEATEASPAGRKGIMAVERSDAGALRVVKAGDFMGLATGDGAPAKPSDEEIKRLAELRGLKWDPKYLERVKMFWASDQRVDGHGDIVMQDWDTKTFQNNPVMPLSHNSHGLGVGSWIDWQVLMRRSEAYTGPALWAMGVYATAEVDEEADRVFRHVDAGLLRMVSVGFFPKKVIDVKDEAERTQLGLGRWGYVLAENELLEISMTLIGANPGALITWQNAKSKNLLKAEDFPFLRELQRASIKRGRGDVAAWTEEDSKLRAIATAIFPDIEWREHKELDAPIVGKASTADVPAPSPAPAPATRTVDERITDLEALVKAQSEEIKSLKSALNGAVCESIENLSRTVNEIRDMVEDLAPAGSAAGSDDDDPADQGKGKAAKSGEEVQPSAEVDPKKNAPMNKFLHALARRGIQKA